MTQLHLLGYLQAICRRSSLIHSLPVPRVLKDFRILNQISRFLSQTGKYCSLHQICTFLVKCRRVSIFVDYLDKVHLKRKFRLLCFRTVSLMNFRLGSYNCPLKQTNLCSLCQDSVSKITWTSFDRSN